MTITISAIELFSVVNQEYTRLRPESCMTCITPIPIRKIPPIGSKWQLSASKPCTQGCREILREIEARLGLEYHLEDRWARNGPV